MSTLTQPDPYAVDFDTLADVIHATAAERQQCANPECHARLRRGNRSGYCAPCQVNREASGATPARKECKSTGCHSLAQGTNRYCSACIRKKVPSEPRQPSMTPNAIRLRRYYEIERLSRRGTL